MRRGPYRTRKMEESPDEDMEQLLNGLSQFATVEDVAKLAHVHHNTVRNAIKAGELEYLRVHRGRRAKILVKREAACRWIIEAKTVYLPETAT